MQPREIALKILYDIEKNQAYLNIAFQNHASRGELSGRDASFVKELVYGCLQHKLSLDYVISRFSSVKLRKLAPYVICILRMGMYQLFYMDKVPESAAVNESVRLAGRYAGRSRGFVNAVLRRASSEGISLPEGSDDETLAIRYSHPAPLVKWLRQQFGEEKMMKLLEENNQAPSLCLRVNKMKTSRQELLGRLAQEGISADAGKVVDSAILVHGGHVQKTEAYHEGLFTVQDQSAQLAAIVLAPNSGETVFDLCAAPGGKTTHLAELMNDEGQIFALDIYEKRLLSVAETAKRLGLSIITTKATDARTFAPQKQADKILIDAPCSGLGVIRRRPDLKYKETLLDFEELVQTQEAILQRSYELLKSGGEMVYSTCTINPLENEMMIQKFLQKHPDCALVPVTHSSLGETARKTLQTGMGTFYPETDLGDGFFIAKLKKE
ncbi:MAG: 16S rRNA (cytosine(967)-C(5))-methyltransferase RsmB [Clostridia bacterium]|nr:16S rRNA (cytosine(967)-C(5))-methyltransferase RsmB [Clostridia bacterium]